MLTGRTDFCGTEEAQGGIHPSLKGENPALGFFAPLWLMCAAAVFRAAWLSVLFSQFRSRFVFPLRTDLNVNLGTTSRKQRRPNRLRDRERDEIDCLASSPPACSSESHRWKY